MNALAHIGCILVLLAGVGSAAVFEPEKSVIHVYAGGVQVAAVDASLAKYDLCHIHLRDNHTSKAKGKAGTRT